MGDFCYVMGCEYFFYFCNRWRFFYFFFLDGGCVNVWQGLPHAETRRDEYRTYRINVLFIEYSTSMREMQERYYEPLNRTMLFLLSFK